MTIVTRHAMRVYATLSGLKADGGEDVLDALIAFTEPVLERMHGKVYDPELLALGMRKLYNWRFNRDMAEHLAGRLLAKGYLRRASQNVFIVEFLPNPEGFDEQRLEIWQVLERVVDEFEGFPDRLTDLFQFQHTRDQMKDALIRFLVSLDAYTAEAFAEEVGRLALDGSRKEVLSGLDEGGRPLDEEMRYVCARFVEHLSSVKPEFVPHLARLASIGLLTEVVEDFVKPTGGARRSDLVAVLDAPVALTLLGLSGKAEQDDIRQVVESLRRIGCRFVVLPVSCSEMSRNLEALLALPPSQRHGPTNDALRKGEIGEDYVRSVMSDPERALAQRDVGVRQISLATHPQQAVHFGQDLYEEFLSEITWHSIDARIHDATCVALTMRLRNGSRRRDPLEARHVFVTTNPVLVRKARTFCRERRLIDTHQVPPVLHQRELAMIAWLRTGLSDGTAGPEIPLNHLLASCERVLRSRPSVTEAVHQKLREFAPEKIDQFELLLSNHRSVQRLMDETLGAERFVTAENAERLLDEMRRATAAEIEEEYARQAAERDAAHEVQMQAQRIALKQAAEEDRRAAALALQGRERELAEKEAHLARVEANTADLEKRLNEAWRAEIHRVEARMRIVNRRIRILDRAILYGLVAVSLVVLVGTMLGYAPQNWVVWSLNVPFSVAVLYMFVQDLRQRPKLGIANVIAWYGERSLRKALLELGDDFSRHRNAMVLGQNGFAWREPGGPERREPEVTVAQFIKQKAA